MSVMPGTLNGGVLEERGFFSPDGANPGAPGGTAWLEKEPTERKAELRDREKGRQRA